MSGFIECMKSELDLFESPPIQTSVIKTEEISYNPIASLDNSSTIEFVSLGNGETYRDLNSIYLRLIVELKGSGSVVNNLLHSLFRNCTVHLNNKNVSQPDNNYHYRAYLETLLNYGNDATSTHLESSGWSVDTKKINGLNEKENPGLDKRKKIFKDGKKVELFGKLHVDIFNQHKYLLNNVDIKVSLNLEKPEFYILENGGKSETFVKIHQANLYMNHLTINNNILLAHHNVLQSRNAIYPYKRVDIKTFTIHPGNHSLILDNVVLGQLPNFLIFGMVSNKAYTGDRKENPFNFQHFNLQRFNLVVNGVQFPAQPIEFSYNSDGVISTRGYQTLFKGTGIHHFDKGHQITKELFDNGYFLLAFDLTPDHSNNSHCGNLINQGSIRIEGRFGEPISEAISCLVYCEFDSILEIDKSRVIVQSL